MLVAASKELDISSYYTHGHGMLKEASGVFW